MKLFFPLIIYIYCARDTFSGYQGGSEGLGAEKGEEGEGRIFRRLEAVLLNLTMKYNSCHLRSTTPVVNEVLLLFLHHIFGCVPIKLLSLSFSATHSMRRQELFGMPTNLFPARPQLIGRKTCICWGKLLILCLTYYKLQKRA